MVLTVGEGVYEHSGNGLCNDWLDICPSNEFRAIIRSWWEASK